MTNSATSTKLHHILQGEGENLNSRIVYSVSERDGVHRQKARLAERAKSGKDWDGTAANDNRIDWPLSRAMIADGNGDLLRVAIRYRTIHSQAMAQPQLGVGVVAGGELQISHRLVDRGDGTMVDKGEVVLRSAAPTESPAMRATPTSSESKKKAAPIPRPWTGDRAVNDAIDARTLLMSLHQRLGPLAEPLEMAVVDGATLEKCGNAAGVANRAGAMSAGKVLVYNGLIMVRGLSWDVAAWVGYTQITPPGGYRGRMHRRIQIN
jgi:hypothetical protein